MSDAFGENIVDDLGAPTRLPDDPDQAARWQNYNRSWWERHPMRYDFGGEIDAPQFTKEFYEEIDRRHFLSARCYLPWKQIPFDSLIDYESLKSKDVLEIGVGNGSHAALLARHAGSYTGIDLTEYAVKSTSTRLKLMSLQGTIRQMDAERMEFPDESFDFIWTWGVIHHSSDTGKILKEMQRVLRPGGKATIMVYHRSWWYYYLFTGIIRGAFSGGWKKTRSFHELNQMYTDGAIARFYRIPEWESLCGEFFRVDRSFVCGDKSTLFPLPGGKFKRTLMGIVPSSFTRLLTNRLKMGEFIVTDVTRV